MLPLHHPLHHHANPHPHTPPPPHPMHPALYQQHQQFIQQQQPRMMQPPPKKVQLNDGTAANRKQPEEHDDCNHDDNILDASFPDDCVIITNRATATTADMMQSAIFHRCCFVDGYVHRVRHGERVPAQLDEEWNWLPMTPRTTTSTPTSL